MSAIEIAAVKTWYRGTLYDSKLEADWAYTMNVLKLPFRYHPGFIWLPSGERYEPDFAVKSVGRLPGQYGEVLLEVKGPHDERIYKTHAAKALNQEFWSDGTPISTVVIGREGPELTWDEPDMVLVRDESGELAFSSKRFALGEDNEPNHEEWYGSGTDLSWVSGSRHVPLTWLRDSWPISYAA